MTINTANINKLIDFLELHPSNFNMKDWNTGQPGRIHFPEPDCDTVMCIGGAANYLHNLEADDGNGESLWSGTRAKEWLGLNDWTGHELFYPSNYGGSLRNITLDEAIKTLTILRDEGRVTWAHTKKDSFHHEQE